MDMKLDFAVTIHSGCDVTGCEPVIGSESMAAEPRVMTSSALLKHDANHYSIEMRNKCKIKH